MKKIIIIFIFLNSLINYSQTTSEKWSSLYKRYEYTDSNGNLIGYKSYNSLTDSWDYTNLNNTVKDVDNRNYDTTLQLLDRAMAAKQNRYDNHKLKYDAGFKKVQDFINKLRKLLAEPDTKEEYDKFEKDVVSKLYNKNYDYSSPQVVDSLIDYIYKGFENLYK